MGYYSKNPYEEPENPRCLECDEQMLDQDDVWFGVYYICTNPDCSECDYKYKVKDEEN
jgi:hypothetical protein